MLNKWMIGLIIFAIFACQALASSKLLEREDCYSKQLDNNGGIVYIFQKGYTYEIQSRRSYCVYQYNKRYELVKTTYQTSYIECLKYILNQENYPISKENLDRFLRQF